MGREIRLFKSEERKSRDEVSTFLRELADKVAEGDVVFRQGQEETRLRLGDNVVLEIQVEDEDKGQKGMQHSLEVEIKWFDDDARGGPMQLG
jgi:amphi-Trp domain-containing protein